MKKEKKILLDNEEVTLLDEEESELMIEILKATSFNSRKRKFMSTKAYITPDETFEEKVESIVKTSEPAEKTVEMRAYGQK